MEREVLLLSEGPIKEPGDYQMLYQNGHTSREAAEFQPGVEY